MTISELITNLEKAKSKWGDIQVFITWEGQVVEIDPISIYKESDVEIEMYSAKKEKSVLFLDADNNHYKSDNAEDID